MRYIAFLLLFSLIYSCKNADSKKIPVKREYKGKIKTVKTGADYFYKVYYFDEAGNDTAICSFGNGDKLLTKVTNKFDANGYLINSESYSVSTNVTYKTSCTYSENGTERTEAYSSSHVDMKYDDRQLVYDLKGNLLEEYILRDDKKILMVRNTYDSANNLIKKNEFSKGCTITYTNDSHGNPVSVKYDLPKLKRVDVKQIEYMYDSKENWTEKAMKNTYGNIESKENSTITYY